MCCQKNNTFQKFVMKVLRRGYMKEANSKIYFDAMREIDIHKMLVHKNVIRLHEIIDDDQDGKVYLVMEYADAGQIMVHDKENNLFLPLGKPNYFMPES